MLWHSGKRVGFKIELAGSTLAITECCVLEQDILSTLVSTGFYSGRPAKNARA